jgi:hypothetical protein
MRAANAGLGADFALERWFGSGFRAGGIGSNTWISGSFRRIGGIGKSRSLL